MSGGLIRARQALPGLAVAMLVTACSGQAASDPTGPSTDHDPSAPTQAAPLTGGDLCNSDVVGFRDGWLASDAGAEAPRQAVEAWRRPGERVLSTAPNHGVSLAAVGTNLHRPRVAFVVKRSAQHWHIARTFGCTRTPRRAPAHCVSRVHFEGRTYLPEHPRIQIGVGRAFGQGAVDGCSRSRDGSLLVLRGPAAPVTVWQEEEVPAQHAIVVSLVPAPVIYDVSRP